MRSFIMNYKNFDIYMDDGKYMAMKINQSGEVEATLSLSESLREIVLKIDNHYK